MYLKFESVAVAAAVLDIDDLSPDASATHVELQSTVGSVRYTMDGTTAPTITTGMLLTLNAEPKLFLIQDLKRMKFIREAAVTATLGVHYIGGRDI